MTITTSSNPSEWKTCKTEGCKHFVGDNDYCFAHDDSFDGGILISSRLKKDLELIFPGLEDRE